MKLPAGHQVPRRRRPDPVVQSQRRGGSGAGQQVAGPVRHQGQQRRPVPGTEMGQGVFGRADRGIQKGVQRKYEQFRNGMMGTRGEVDETTRHMAAAAAWGLFPE